MNPKHGMWLGMDSMGYKDSPNLYAYCGQNPIDFVDPMGLNKNGPAEKNSKLGKPVMGPEVV